MYVYFGQCFKLSITVTIIAELILPALIIKPMLLKHLTLPELICLDELLNIDNPYFEQMVSQIYPTGLLSY